MTLDELRAKLRSKVEEKQQCCLAEEEVVSTDETEEDANLQDLYEALDLLGQMSEKITQMLKIDLAHKSLTHVQKAEINDLLAEVQTFYQQWEWENDQ